MKRRSALKIVSGGLLADRADALKQQLFQLAAAPAVYRLQFFTPAQDKTIEILTEALIPADDHSPGAAEAKVNLFIDLMVSNSDASVRRDWTQGLAALDAESQRRYQAAFAGLSPDRRHELLASIAQNEMHPATELESFFRKAKLMTINGYYTSPIGIHRDLKYIGNTALVNYYGCTHETGASKA